MPRLALLLLALLAGLVVGLRLALHRRRHGAGAFVALRRGGSRWERISGALLAAGLLLTMLAWGAWSAGIVRGAFAPPWPMAIAGAVAWLVGTVLVWRAQEAMGVSFRMGVDAADPTELVTRGPFARVRNPIYAGLLLSLGGLLALAPHAGAGLGWLLLAAAFHVQVVRVEEPSLARRHGRAWSDYAARAGRFLPRIGRRRAA